VSPVAAPADRRFRRAHVKPGRRRGAFRVFFRPAKYGLLVLAAVYTAYRGTAVVAHARVLRVDRIVVQGNERLSNDEVMTILNGLRGENIVWTDLGEWRRRLLSSPWVREAALRRSLPSTVEVVVSERAPVAIGRLNGDLYLIDEGGVVIDQYGPQYADLDLPIVDGLGTNGGGDAMIDQPRAGLAARLVASLRPQPEVAHRLSQIDVTDVHNVAVILTGDPAVIYVGEDRFLPRLQSYLELSATLRERVVDIDYVDLRFDGRIYVRPVKASKKSAVLARAAPVAIR
jgi:cell division protein FtsQ